MQGITIRITRGQGDQVETIELSSEPARTAAVVEFPRIKPSAARRYVDNGDRTITDSSTGLQWSRETLNAKCVKHAEAEKVCASLRLAGHADWRLPTRAELLTLVDDTRHEPAIDTDAFPDTKNDWYWTSTIAAWSSDLAWIVSFGSGGAFSVRRGNGGGFVRAVRVASPGQ